MSRDNSKHGFRVPFEVGSLPPEGYLSKQDWAAAQMAGGLKQIQCGRCGLWLFPQEIVNHKNPEGRPCNGK